jgi:chorismate synthase
MNCNGSSFGTLFRITTFGESHGQAMGVIVDGCPSGLKLDLDFINQELDRRRPGQSKVVTQRKELDQFEILSGVYQGITLGTPIAFVVKNTDVKSKDYDEIKSAFRPGHADFTYFAKYGHRDPRGGGRASARETVARVIGGAVAKQLLKTIGVSFVGGLVQLGTVIAKKRVWEEAENNELRCLDPDVLEQMRLELEQVRADRDSTGGVVEVQALNVPVGLGEPVFGKLDAAIGSAMLSIPAVKGVEIGAGFSCVSKKGSEVNDEMYKEGFASNNHGGILGGISSGAPIVVRIALKPTSSIPKEKNTIDENFNEVKLMTKGRHDPCVAIRAVPIAESMLALVLVDYWLQHLAQIGTKKDFKSLNYRIVSE